MSITYRRITLEVISNKSKILQFNIFNIAEKKTRIMQFGSSQPLRRKTHRFRLITEAIEFFF